VTDEPTDEPTPDDPALAVTDRELLRARALVLHDLAARGADTADVVDLVETALAQRRWWVQSWPDGLPMVAGQLAQDVQDVMIDTEGRWPACPVHRAEALQVEPELGADPEWVCEHGCGVLAPLGALAPLPTSG
jgi:hypothetical protein